MGAPFVPNARGGTARASEAESARDTAPPPAAPTPARSVPAEQAADRRAPPGDALGRGNRRQQGRADANARSATDAAIRNSAETQMTGGRRGRAT